MLAGEEIRCGTAAGNGHLPFPPTPALECWGVLVNNCFWSVVDPDLNLGTDADELSGLGKSL